MAPKKSPETIQRPPRAEPQDWTECGDLALVLKAAHWAHVFQTEKNQKGSISPEYLEVGLVESRLIDAELKTRDLQIG